ncbi:RPM1-interacting protein 4-like [Wolffia australiana]
MAAKSRVPQFGEWEQQVPYTLYFEKARGKKVSGTSLKNPNDPEENPGFFKDQQRQKEEEHQEQANEQFNSEQMKSPYQSKGNQREDDSAEIKKAATEGSGLSQSPPQNRKLRPKFAPQAETKHRSVAVPKFGVWDGGNAETGGGFTMIFEKVKEEKANAAAHPPAPSFTPPRNNYQQPHKVNTQTAPRSRVFCCFCPKVAS